MVAAGDRRTSHARCRSASSRAASRRRRTRTADRRGSRSAGWRDSVGSRCHSKRVLAAAESRQQLCFMVSIASLSPVAGDRHPGGDGGQRRGFGAQDARAEADRRGIGRGADRGGSSAVKPPSGPVRISAGPGVKALARRLAAALVGEVQRARRIAALEEGVELHRLVDFGQRGPAALLGRLDDDAPASARG